MSSVDFNLIYVIFAEKIKELRQVNFMLVILDDGSKNRSLFLCSMGIIEIQNFCCLRTYVRAGEVFGVIDIEVLHV